MSEHVDYVVAIPARYASTRLAGKPLAQVGGEPMICQVCKKALASQALGVIACVDHEAVAAALAPLALENSRLRVCMTSQKPRSGTERIAEMLGLEHYPQDLILVNVQGDEPLITPEHIDTVAELIATKNADMSTLCSPITTVRDVFDPNCVKVVFNQDHFAQYFSRAPIPYERDNFMAGDVTELKFKHYRHIGIYGYRVRTILDYLQREPAELEQAESLEQLRLLHYGMSIAVAITERPPECGVDTAEDLACVNQILAAQS